MSVKKISQNKTYPKAPILEAICDISVQLPIDFRVSEISKFARLYKKDYPISEKINEQTLTVAMGEQEPSVMSSQAEQGLKLTSVDRKYVIQAKRTGFTFSQVNSYDSWKHFHDKFWPIWTQYVEQFGPLKVTRVALRYINRIDIPKTDIKLEDFFLSYPKIFGGQDAAKLSGFFMQAQLPQKEGGMALFNQAIADPPAYGFTSFILDIDVFEVKDFEPKGSELSKRIEKLRKQKNFIFENSITDLTRGLIS